MGDVINLRLAKKAKARKVAEKTATENRVRFGQTKAEKQLRKAEDALSKQRLESGKLEPEKS